MIFQRSAHKENTCSNAQLGATRIFTACETSDMKSSSLKLPCLSNSLTGLIIVYDCTIASATTLASYSDEDYTAIGEAYCADMDVWVSGDAKDSGGCVDPSFWPIHGALERMYQYRFARSSFHLSMISLSLGYCLVLALAQMQPASGPPNVCAGEVVPRTWIQTTCASISS